MFLLVLISSAVVQVLSTTNIYSDVVQRDILLGAFYGGVNQRFSEFSKRNDSMTTLTGRNYDDALCTSQFLNAIDALNRTDLWALSGKYTI